MKRKTIFIILSVVLLLIVLIVGKKAGWFGGNSDVLTVETEKITPTTIVQKVSATGKIQPELEIKLSSEVSGEIIELPVKEGQMVKKGDLLVRINPDIPIGSKTQCGEFRNRTCELTTISRNAQRSRRELQTQQSIVREGRYL